MSTTIQLQNGSQMIVTSDLSKFCIGFNAFISANYTDSGSGSTLTQGLVMGRIAATGLIVPCDPTAVDGSQYPVGLVIEEKVVTAAATVAVTMVNKGRVASSLITLKSGVALTDEIDGRRLSDWLNDLGLELSGGEDLTAYDNY